MAHTVNQYRVKCGCGAIYPRTREQAKQIALEEAKGRKITFSEYTVEVDFAYSQHWGHTHNHWHVWTIEE